MMQVFYELFEYDLITISTFIINNLFDKILVFFYLLQRNLILSPNKSKEANMQ